MPMATSLFVDAASLSDLHVVPSASVRGTTLWSLVDRTRSRVGSEALREKLLKPPHQTHEILALQHAHQILAANADIYRSILDRIASDEIERYLNVTWQLPNRMPPMARLRKWHPQYMQDVAHGRTLVKSLLTAVAELRDQLTTANSAILMTLAGRITGTLHTDQVGELGRLSSLAGTSASVRDFDQCARDTAKPALVHLLQDAGRVEALWSLSVATREHGWTYPSPSTQLQATGLFHPFLGRGAVANDLTLGPGVRVCFVTGPKMAGKSTFLKAVAIAVLLAHAGAGVPAATMEFAPVGAIFSSVQIADNLAAGESFYLAEVRRMGALAGALDDHGSAVAVIDEPFRGTNVHDAAEATLAVITRIAEHPTALIFVASHVGEVVPHLRSDSRVKFLYFAADVTDEQPHFDYQLREGVSEQRLGMTLLRQERVLERLERAASAKRTPPDVY